jgi:hypothetical protein
LLDSPEGFVTVATIVTRVLLLAAGLIGCGPVQVVGQVSGRTSAALVDADLAEADRLAPYEYTKARAYDRKAREEAAESSFELAIAYGRRAEEFARRAETIARERAARTAPAPGAGASAGPREP